MSRAILCLAFLVLTTHAASYGPAVPEEKPFLETSVVCPENGPFAFSHGSTIVEFPDGSLFCAWYAGSREKGDDVAIVASERPAGAPDWSEPRVLVDTPGKSEGNPVLFLDADGLLWLFYQTMYGSGEGPTRQGTGWTTCKVKAITSADRGRTWSDERILIDELGYLTRNKPEVLDNGTILLPLQDERNWSSAILRSTDKGKTWEMSAPIDCGLGFHNGNIEPALLERHDGSVLCYMRTGSDRFRTWESTSSDGGRTWTPPVETEIPNPNAALDLLRLDTGHVLMALNPVPEGGRVKLGLWLSTDDAGTWTIRRDIANGPGHSSYPALIQNSAGAIHLTCSRPDGGIRHYRFNEAWIWQDALVAGEYTLANVVPPLDDSDDPRAALRREPGELPIVVEPSIQHVRDWDAPKPDGPVLAVAYDTRGVLNALNDRSEHLVLRADGSWEKAAIMLAAVPREGGWSWSRQGRFKLSLSGAGLMVPDPQPGVMTTFCSEWLGTNKGLYRNTIRHDDYGVDGPLSTTITALALDSKGALWVGTPLGLSVREPDGAWRHIRGKDGLPYEDITCIAGDSRDRFWIGTTRGAIHYRPYEEGRQWFYRAGQRYLPDDHVLDVAVSPKGDVAWFATAAGLGCIRETRTTLLEKAQVIERRVDERHRRLGLVAECNLDNAENPTSHTIHDNDNDGLWTSYHVAAMSLCYAVTADDAALESARESMHALYMLQNASGTPGLVARSVLPAEEGSTRGPQWRPTPDGTMYWKSDTSNDEIDGHYLAFYTYWEHIARFIPEERTRLITQITTLTDYLVDNGYVLIDWDGERTRWGFWSPELLNGDATHYLESGLNALQMLNFLKVTHYVTGDAKYKEHYDRLIAKHGYLSNILLAKKLFPDENNHSDDQLGYVAWYPILQLEQDPKVREALHKGVRRHYKVVAPERPSFYAFVTATIDAGYVDLQAAVENLRNIPADRRHWRMENSRRADVVFDPRLDRFGERQVLQVLPADERDFAKWNRNPYLVDEGGDGRHEDDGAAYLLPYWMGRYHRFIAEAD